MTNKNKTAIAPTYIIIKIKPKNSTFKRNKMAAALQKVKIKKRTDSIEVFERETNAPLPKSNEHKNKCRYFIKKINFFRDNVTRTHDFLFPKQTRYQLRYIPMD